MSYRSADCRDGRRIAACELPPQTQRSFIHSGKGKDIPVLGPEGFQEFEAHEGGKFVSPTHRPPLPPGNIPGANFC